MASESSTPTKEALKIAGEQFDYVDLCEYSASDIVIDVADLMVDFAKTQNAVLLESYKQLRDALKEIASYKPEKEPKEKDSHWGNEDDAEYHGYKSASWFLGEIAEKALKKLRGE